MRDLIEKFSVMCDWNLSFATLFSQTILFLVLIYRELGLLARAPGPIKISVWLISNFTR